MSKYFYNGVDIGNIVYSGFGYGGGVNNTTYFPGESVTKGINTDNSEGYTGFPGQKLTPGGVEKINLNVYSYQGLSILATNRIAQYYDYNNSGTFNVPFNGVNSLVVAIIGSGGGGGGAGNGYFVNKHSGGPGGDGGCPFGGIYTVGKVNSYTINIGNGGALGGRGPNVYGGNGNATQFNSSARNININGGNGGQGGFNGSPNANGGAGAPGNIGNDAPGYGAVNWTSVYSLIPSNIGNALQINMTNYTYLNNLINSSQGSNGTSINADNSVPGTGGVKGYVRVYFLFN